MKDTIDEESFTRSELKCQTRTISPLNSLNGSRIMLNCSKYFGSLRIEDPKRSSQEDGNSTIRTLQQGIPELTQLFTIHQKVGEGTFSKVYLAKSIADPSKEFALKCIVPTVKPTRVAAELRFLRDLGGDSNVAGIHMCLFGRGFSVFVMPYFRHDTFTEYVRDLSHCEIQEYMKNLLIALRKVHSHGIIHRDIKPTNFLFNRRERRYLLVDFGLSQSESDLQRAGKHIVAQAMATNKKTVLKDTTKAAANVVITEQNPKPLLIRKRTLNELNSKRSQITKRTKLDNELQKSSVSITPETPDDKKAKTMNGEGVNRTPMKCIRNENLKTPIKDSSSHIIPETPPKSLNGKQKMNESQNKSTKPRVRNTKSVKSAEDICDCFEKPQLCTVCTRRGELLAPRAGTPGFRAPEVLLKYLHQTTAIDVWSAGVIFASLLSCRYPFFRNTDDLTSLAEIITVLGTKRMIKTAHELNKTLVISAKNKPPVCLKLLCERLRAKDDFQIDDSAYDLLEKLLEPNPSLRITAEEALRHPFLVNV